MPHTVHLAALKVRLSQFCRLCNSTHLFSKLLEAIGAVTKSKSAKASSRKGSYQETVTLNVDWANDEEAAIVEDHDKEPATDESRDKDAVRIESHEKDESNMEVLTAV